jgi:hypothetical protein
MGKKQQLNDKRAQEVSTSVGDCSGWAGLGDEQRSEVVWPPQTNENHQEGRPPSPTRSGHCFGEQVTNEDLQARLWNREVLRIHRTELIWDTQNMRWEADA